MKNRILLLFAVPLALASCTTMYKSGQTPDDVYYSPGREVAAYVPTEQNNNQSKYNQQGDMSDAYLRMKAYNYNRWSAFDNDFMYWNDWRWNNQFYYNTFNPYYPTYGSGWSWSIGMSYGYPYYGTGMGIGFGYGWGGYYNPFCPGYYGTPVIIVNPKNYNPAVYQPRTTNLDAINARNNYRNYTTDPKTGNRVYNITSPTTSPVRTFRSGGSGVRSRFDNGGSYNNNLRYDGGSSSSPTRSFNNSSSGSRSSGSGVSGGSRGGGGGAPTRSFPRGGGGQ